MLWNRAASWPLHSTTTACSFPLCYKLETTKTNKRLVNNSPEKRKELQKENEETNTPYVEVNNCKFDQAIILSSATLPLTS
jgi:hypothetical protein